MGARGARMLGRESDLLSSGGCTRGGRLGEGSGGSNGSGAVNLPSRQKRKRRRVSDRTGLRKRSVYDSKV
jgi:hypothetical protein